MQSSLVFPGAGSSRPPCLIHRCCLQGRKHQAAFKQTVQIPANSTSCISFLHAIKQIEIGLLPKLFFSLSLISPRDSVESSGQTDASLARWYGIVCTFGCISDAPWDSSKVPGTHLRGHTSLGHSSCSGGEAGNQR